MARSAQGTEAVARETVDKGSEASGASGIKKSGVKRKARDQLQLLLEKRKREDEIRARLAAFAEEMERARKQRDLLPQALPGGDAAADQASSG